MTMIPEGMTADKLRDIAEWLDTYDRLAKVFLEGLVRGGMKTSEEIQSPLAATQSTVVQDELRAWADAIEPSPALPYVCSKCGAEGVKLWRQWNTMAVYINLLCASCASEDQHEPLTDIDARGCHIDDRGWRTDKIGNLICAVPTVDGETYWGYTSIPQDLLETWYALPNEND